MSAAGRLWRRAPAWRVCVVIAVASTALAAMFPPRVPGWVRRAALPTESVTVAKPGNTAHFQPETAQAAGYSALQLPRESQERSGVVAFAGRGLPLPAGRWKTLVLAHGDLPISGQVEVFGRVEGGALTGLLIAAAPDAVAHALSPFNVQQDCEEPDTVANWVAPEPFGQDPLVHECWRLSSLRGFDLAERGRQEPVLDRALLRLKESDVSIPDKLMLVDYLRSDDSGFLTALLYLPERRGGLVDWVKRYVSVLHRAYDGERAGLVVPADPG